MMEDLNNYPSYTLAKRATSADGDQDKLKMLSEGIQNAVAVLLVSLPCGSGPQFNQSRPIKSQEMERRIKQCLVCISKCVDCIST